MIASLGRLACAPILLGMLSSTAWAQDDQQSYDITTVTCGDVMILSGMDRDTTLAFIHGFIVGASGEADFIASKLTDATVEFLDECIQTPDALAVETMRGLLKT